MKTLYEDRATSKILRVSPDGEFHVSTKVVAGPDAKEPGKVTYKDTKFYTKIDLAVSKIAQYMAYQNCEETLHSYVECYMEASSILGDILGGQA